MRPYPERVVITGASGAIGSALARHYAGTGVTLILQGRSRTALEQIAADCERRGARVVCEVVDLLVDGAGRDLARRCSESGGVDLAILNAGMNGHARPGEGLEPFTEAESLLRLNVLGTQAMFDSLARDMKGRGAGQIALVSSLAAEVGLPPAPAYSASKAALKAYGEAMRGVLAPFGVRVNVVMPGYVRSPMCQAMPGPKPFLMDADRAATRIARGLARNHGRIAFPFWLALGTRWLGMLPLDWALALLKRLGYRVP